MGRSGISVRERGLDMVTLLEHSREQELRLAARSLVTARSQGHSKVTGWHQVAGDSMELGLMLH